jgi:putative DNA primase/helicase
VTYVYRTARQYIAKGIPVFPCAQGAKHPLTRRGFRDASSDPSLLEHWANAWPRANLAIPTGPRSGFLVLDVDRKDVDGLQTLAALEQTLGALPETLVAATPSGGEHRYFRARDASIRNAAGRIAGESAPGVDVRGEGGYVLIAPSEVGDKPYTWKLRAPVAELAPAWAEALRPPSREQVPAEPWTPRDEREQSRAQAWCVRALQSEARELATAAQGTRNDHLWRAAAALGGLIHLGAIDAEDVRGALLWACGTWTARNPRKDRETIERAIGWGRANPRRIDLEDRRGAA